MKYLILFPLTINIYAVDIELETISNDTSLKGAIINNFKEQDIIVKDSVSDNRGMVIYWCTPLENERNLDCIEIYDYKSSEFKNDGIARYHNQVPLRYLYNLTWHRNENINKDTQIKGMSLIVKMFLINKWEKTDCTITKLWVDNDININIQNELKQITVKDSITNVYVNVNGTGKKDGNIILKYNISLLTSNLKDSIQPMDKPNIGLLGRLEVCRYKNGKDITVNQIANTTNALLKWMHNIK